MKLLCLLLLSLVVAAQVTVPCQQSFIDLCISNAISTVCGPKSFSDPDCICGASGYAQLQSIAGLCLLQGCPTSQIIAIGGSANTACGNYQSTRSLTATSIPVSTTSSGSSTSVTGISITGSATSPSGVSASNTGTSSHSSGLSTRAKAGIAVGASIVLVAILFSIGVYLYRRHERRRRGTASGNELQAELPDNKSTVHLNVVDIPLRELDGEDAFRYRNADPVEADSRSARAGHPVGKMAGTEATAFDFDSQKVLLDPATRMKLPGHGSTTSLQR